MEQALRKLTVRLETSGTATVMENTMLYKGSYAFVWLRAIVPVTQNSGGDTIKVCTVHAVTIDPFGVRKQVGNKFFTMKLADTVTINGFDYYIFERAMPKLFTDTEGDLDIIYNFSEITPEGKLAARLATNIIHKRVEPGGEADGEIDVDLDLAAAAQIGQNTEDIDDLKRVFAEYKTSIDFLFNPIDNSEANKSGNARVEIENNRLKFIEIRGEDGVDGTDGKDGTDGESAYEIAVKNGYIGTETEWLAALRGANGVGKDGANGVIINENVFLGFEQQEEYVEGDYTVYPIKVVGAGSMEFTAESAEIDGYTETTITVTGV